VVVDPVPAPGPAAAGLDLSDPLALVPADSDFVLTLDIAALHRSALWTRYEHEALALLAPSFAACDFNPLAEMSTITAGIPMGSEQGVFVFRGLDRDRTLGCLHRSGAHTDPAISFDGEFVTLSHKSGAVNMVTFVDPRTMVMQGSKHPTKASLRAALTMGAPLRHDARYLAAAAKVPRGSVLAMVARPDSTQLGAALEAKVGVPVRGFYAALEVSDRIELHAAIEVANAADAPALVERMRPQLETARAYFDRFDARADGAEVMLELALNEDQLRMFVDLGKSMMATDAR
jgi:hypothetical protein